MNNAQQEKISKTSKILSRILAVACVLSALATALVVLGIAILTFADSKTALSLQKAFTTLSLAGNIETPSLQNLTILFSFAIIQLVLFFLVFLLLYRVFSAIAATSTPFEKIQVKSLKQVALTVLILCIATTITDSIGNFLLYGAATLKINLMWFVIAIVIYCLALIFEYGMQLQKQSDETL